MSIFVVDKDGNKVVKYGRNFSPEGEYGGLDRGSGPDELNSPTSVAFFTDVGIPFIAGGDPNNNGICIREAGNLAGMTSLKLIAHQSVIL